MRFAKTMVILCAATCGQLYGQAPTWDSSGNSLLNGTYYFRDVLYYVTTDGTGDLSRAIATYGTITFNGSGGYSIPNATVYDSNVGSLQTLATTGTYTTGANGYTQLSHPLFTPTATTSVNGLVSANGVFVGSATESGRNDLFIAAPIGPTPATNASFNGSYTVSTFFPGGTPTGAADATYQLNPNGAGSLGTVNITGYAGGSATVYTQTATNVTYSFSNGAGVVKFPVNNSANFYSGSAPEYLYISSDGSFIFGGSPQDWDMIIGVKNNGSGAATNFSGIYYEAGLDEDTSTLGGYGYAGFDTFYGSYSANAGNVVGHERLYTPVYNTAPEGFTYTATYPTTISNSTYTDAAGTTQYTFGNGGAIRIGFGIGPYLSLSVGLKAPTLTPGSNSVYLNPQGVNNAASFAPFTAGISAGEFIVLYGNNLAPSTQVASALPFPTTLNGVSVTVDGIKAPIYYVSPTQISIIVPYAANTYSVANIQVTNGGATSNTISQGVNPTTPGIFSLTANGLGDGAIEHANGSVVTASNPAQPGETVAMFMSGLGAVFPPSPEGAPGPTSPLSNATNTFAAYVGPNKATIAYAGLAPYLAGVYQMNLTIPAAATSGDTLLDVIGPDSENIQAFIPIGNGVSTASDRPGPTVESLSRTDRPRRAVIRR